MEYVIRPLIPTNIDDVYQYFEVLKRSTETEKKTGALMRIREEIENVNTIKNSCNNISDKVFGLFIENFLVGIGKIEQMWPDYSRGNHNFHIGPLYILSEYRGRGYGRKIMEALEEYALEKINGPIVKFNLGVTEGNEIPLKLYFSMGYTIIGRDSKHIRMGEDIFLDRILMTKVIYK